MKSYNENKTVSGASSEGCAKDNRCGGGVCGRSRVGTSTSDRGLTVYILMMASLLFIALVSVKGVTSFAVDIPSADEDTILFHDNNGEGFGKRSSAMHFYKRAAFPAGDLRRSSPWHYGKRSSAMHFYKKTPSLFAAVPSDDSFSNFY